MEILGKLQNLIYDVKSKLTSNEYKQLMDATQALHKELTETVASKYLITYAMVLPDVEIDIDDDSEMDGQDEYYFESTPEFNVCQTELYLTEKQVEEISDTHTGGYFLSKLLFGGQRTHFCKVDIKIRRHGTSRTHRNWIKTFVRKIEKIE